MANLWWRPPRRWRRPPTSPPTSHPTPPPAPPPMGALLGLAPSYRRGPAAARALPPRCHRHPRHRRHQPLTRRPWSQTPWRLTRRSSHLRMMRRRQQARRCRRFRCAQVSGKGRPAAAALSAARSPDAPCRLATSPSRNHGWQRVELSAGCFFTPSGLPVCFHMTQALCSHDGEILSRRARGSC